MQLFETKLVLTSTNWGVSVEVLSTDPIDLLRAVYRSDQTSDYATINMILDHDYVIEEQKCLSFEVRDLLNIVGNEWVRDHKISAIRLVRKFTNCSLLDAKNAVEGYSA